MTNPALSTAAATSIYERVAAVSGLTLDQLLSDSRQDRVCRARYLVMRAMRNTGASLFAIGRKMQRDHSTIVNGLSRYEVLLDENDDFARMAREVLG